MGPQHILQGTVEVASCKICAVWGQAAITFLVIFTNVRVNNCRSSGGSKGPDQKKMQFVTLLLSALSVCYPCCSESVPCCSVPCCSMPCCSVPLPLSALLHSALLLSALLLTALLLSNDQSNHKPAIWLSGKLTLMLSTP